ncbi:MAG: bifunctional phosphoribosylaminoimidazolecarboxamide formyltransferase/IMP cyclohydrolase [Candidatus Aureabacteria bacterium]|nr:bifunctional phosphoribosylaminoimidazolecarboxamide formyltransferase/IMP cyclohydrolase [Candidatus Auribacterota bacterium]
MIKIKRALISVSDKTGLSELCHLLQDLQVEIISTGGTAKMLTNEGIKIMNISDYTGFPEILDGRVKTLHPKIHGGLLGLRDKEDHVQTMKEMEIQPIDLVVVNLYPFEEVSKRKEAIFEEVIENIDIGGPSMLRSAAKNFISVAVVTHPSQYEKIMKELKEHDGYITLETRKELAYIVFELTSRYDSMIAQYLIGQKDLHSGFPARFRMEGEKIYDLRYGENPHQEAAFYKTDSYSGNKEPSVVSAVQLQGKELSFNNILDLDGALSCIKEFKHPACVVVKHTNPCGVSVSSDSVTALKQAWEADSVSAFGSVIAFNRELDEACARFLSQYFVEVIIAPSFSLEAKNILQSKANLRLMELNSLLKWIQHPERDDKELDVKKVAGGFLLQKRDLKMELPEGFEVVTKNRPLREDMDELAFAWKVVKHVKSNAIVYTKNKTTLGIGAGQMSRVDSVKFGAMKAAKNMKSLRGSVLASDAFFPFRDGVDEAYKHEVKAIIQPGGSIRDKEVIDACNEHGIAMVLTKTRHFKH